MLTRASIISFVTVMSLGFVPRANSAAIALFQDELIRKSDVIAIVEIFDRVVPPITGVVLHDKTEFPTSPILYQSKVVKTLFGTIPSEPLIIQFDGAGDRNPLEKGRYLLFLRSEGHLYTPIETDFKINHGKVFWFTKSFLTGGYGPAMGEVPLDQTIFEIKVLIEKYKKS